MKKGLTIWMVAAIAAPFIANLDNTAIAVVVFINMALAYHFNNKYNKQIFGNGTDKQKRLRNA